MQILKESKEKLPVAFITSFVSEGWEKVGILKEEIEAIKKEFSETTEVEVLIQGLIDAYLVCIGQMEQHLADKKGIEIPTVEEVKESLNEDVTINIDTVEVANPEIKVKSNETESCDQNCPVEINDDSETITEPEQSPTTEEPIAAPETEKTEEISNVDRLEEIEEACKKETINEEFEYFVGEFPDPVEETNID